MILIEKVRHILKLRTKILLKQHKNCQKQSRNDGQIHILKLNRNYPRISTKFF